MTSTTTTSHFVTHEEKEKRYFHVTASVLFMLRKRDSKGAIFLAL